MLPHDHVLAPACLFCGDPERVELLEVWTDHTFMLETCCEALYETLVQEMEDDPVWARELLRNLGIESFTGQRLRRLADDGCCGMVLDWQLQHRPVSLPAARSL